jgi:hypothetical protein
MELEKHLKPRNRRSRLLSGRRRILLQELVQRVRGLSPLCLPILEAGAVQIQHTFMGGMKGADVFEVTAVTGVAVIGNDDSEKRRLFRAMAGKANVNGHTVLNYLRESPEQQNVSTGQLTRQEPDDSGLGWAKRAGT